MSRRAAPPSARDSLNLFGQPDTGARVARPRAADGGAMAGILGGGGYEENTARATGRGGARGDTNRSGAMGAIMGSGSQQQAAPSRAPAPASAAAPARDEPRYAQEDHYDDQPRYGDGPAGYADDRYADEQNYGHGQSAGRGGYDEPAYQDDYAPQGNYQSQGGRAQPQYDDYEDAPQRGAPADYEYGSPRTGHKKTASSNAPFGTQDNTPQPVRSNRVAPGGQSQIAFGEANQPLPQTGHLQGRGGNRAQPTSNIFSNEQTEPARRGVARGGRPDSNIFNVGAEAAPSRPATGRMEGKRNQGTFQLADAGVTPAEDAGVRNRAQFGNAKNKSQLNFGGYEEGPGPQGRPAGVPRVPSGQSSSESSRYGQAPSQQAGGAHTSVKVSNPSGGRSSGNFIGGWS